MQLLSLNYNSEVGSGFLTPRRRDNSVWRLGPLLILCMSLVACGGGAGSSPVQATNTGQSTSNPAPPAPEGGGQLRAPTPVDVRSGSGASNVDVTVVSAASSPAPNAQDLGVNSTTGRASASNTGGVIHRGSTMRVILFGPGSKRADAGSDRRPRRYYGCTGLKHTSDGQHSGNRVHGYRERQRRTWSTYGFPANR